MRKVVAPAPSVQVVVFRLGGSEFAVDVFAVQEILRRQPAMPVPDAPGFVTGVIEMRGSLIPLLDLRRRLGVAEPVESGSTRIMIARLQGERIGLLVDAVTEVLRVPETAIGEPPSYIREVAAEFVASIVRLPDRLVLVLDLQRILGEEELIALRELEPLIEKARAESAADAAAEAPSPPKPAGES